MLSYGSVCSGVEAATLAWEQMGWRACWFSEIEKFPSAVLAHRWPDVPNMGDMTSLPARVLAGEIPAPDLLVGGTPCQAFSIIGLRNGLKDARGQLTMKFVELANAIDIVRLRNGKPPAIIIWENVPGVLSQRDNAFGNFLSALAGDNEAFEPCIKPEQGKRSAYWRWSKKDGQHFPNWPFAGGVYGPQRHLAWRVLDAQYFGVPQRRKRVFLVASAGKEFDPASLLFEFEGQQGHSSPCCEAQTEIARLVTPGAAKQREIDLVAFGGGNCSGPLTVSTTLTAHGNRMDFDTETFIVHQHPSPVLRRLMPVEYERLQGFPEGHTRIPWPGRNTGVCPDAPRMKAAGNSMAVPVMRWLGERTERYLKSSETMTATPPKLSLKAGVSTSPVRVAINRPVFKWAGGKFTVLNEIAEHMPPGERLIEPFVGGGSVFMNLDYARYLCGDLNSDLITAYTMIRDRPDHLLRMIKARFDKGNTQLTYLNVRDNFNDLRNSMPALERAADFIYLNRHCFNGLMRYNLKGEFNVGFGDYKRPYLPEKELKVCAARCARAEFNHASFSYTISRAGVGDVIFCDPPYQPHPDTKGFTSYATGRFTMDDQAALVHQLKAAHKRGAKVVITNSSAKLVVELYRDHGFTINPLRARRIISSKASTRTYADDIIATLK